MWSLEVQKWDDETWRKYIKEGEIIKEGEEKFWVCKFVHVGYMKMLFKTKKMAEEYYNMHNPHMRPLNAYNTWISDWDPETKFRYIVRRNCNERKIIQPFKKLTQ